VQVTSDKNHNSSKNRRQPDYQYHNSDISYALPAIFHSEIQLTYSNATLRVVLLQEMAQSRRLHLKKAPLDNKQDHNRLINGVSLIIKGNIATHPLKAVCSTQLT
jgi:hypothetical protein